MTEIFDFRPMMKGLVYYAITKRVIEDLSEPMYIQLFPDDFVNESYDKEITIP